MRKGTRVKMLRDMSQYELYRGRQGVIAIPADTLGTVKFLTEWSVIVDFEGVDRSYAIVHKDLEVVK